MGMIVKIPDGVKRINVLFKKRLNENVPIALAQALEEQLTLIQVRTQRGQEYTGGAFANYAASTREQRARRGYTTFPNLTRTGQLMTSLRSEVKRHSGFVEGFIKFLNKRYPRKSSKATKQPPTTTQVARWLNDGTSNMPARKFFGMSAKGLQDVINKVRKALNE